MPRLPTRTRNWRPGGDARQAQQQPPLTLLSPWCDGHAPDFVLTSRNHRPCPVAWSARIQRL